MNVPNVDLNGSPTVISTFAGCGGSSLGYQLAGFRELLAVEWDNNAVETFKLNFPDVPVFHGDIKKLSGERCMNMAGIVSGELDVLDGSPPCQGFSTAGKRKFDDPRNSLFNEYARLLEELQPRVFVMENVTGLVKGCMKQAYLMIVKTLRECGYEVRGEVLNAMYFNVPQSRQRVIVIGVRNDLGTMPSHPRPETRPITVREAFDGCPHTCSDGLFLGRRLEIAKGILPWHDDSDVVKGQSFNLKRLAWDKPSRTILKSIGVPSSSYGGGLIHPSIHRHITIDELKRLASFPDSFQFIGKYRQQWERIGNSVPPNLMKAISEHIKTNILVSSKVGID